MSNLIAFNACQYRVRAYNAFAVSTNSNVISLIITGDLLLQQGLSLYPNPAGDFLYISGINVTNKELFAIDLTGHYYSIKLYPQGDILKGDISNLSRGMYILRITSDSINQIKFIKQ